MTSIVDAVRQPEYTGENRCMPCTIANTAIATVLAVALAAALVAMAGTATSVAAAAGVGLFVASMVAIYLRGYLVPKTPELTKQYFPERVLAWFDQLPEEPGSPSPQAGGEGDPDLEPEAALQSAGAVEPCVEVDDLCLAEEFHGAWRERAVAVREDGVETDDILAALDMTDLSEEAHLRSFGDAVVLERDTQEIGKWESQAALVADVAAADALADRYDRWDDLDAFDRSRLLRGLRIFLEECPLCDGPISLGQETVESCCRSYDVVAVTCGECEARLFEQRWDGPPEAGAEGGEGGEPAGSASPT